MNSLLTQFLTEAKELLESIAEKLMQLEKNPSDAELVNELFRLVHTLKGNSGLFDFPEMTRVLHASEDLMDKVRGGKIVFRQDLADQLLDAMDFVSLLCDEVALEKPSLSHGPDAFLLAEALRQLIPAGALATVKAPAVPAPTVLSPRPGHRWQDLPEKVREKALARQKEGATLLWVTYAPSEGTYFSGVDPFHSARTTPGVFWGRVVPREPWPPLAELDAYRCTLNFEILTNATRDQVNSHFRYVLDQVQVTEVVAEVPIPALTVATVFEAQRQILLLDDQAAWTQGRYKAVASVLANACRSQGDAQGPEAIERALAQTLATGDKAPLLAWVEAKLAAPAEEPIKYGRRAEDTSLDLKSIRVDQEKIDTLMDLIGEMVVSKNGLPYLAGRAETSFGQRELGREIRVQHAVIDRIATELQDAILQVRMLPMSYVFQRFPRLVREVSRKLDKKVNLVLEGEQTEADKNIIASLADPLMHIVRNSLDHGIETPAVRLACGKPDTGTLTLRARQEADRAVIEILDDGKGIDPGVIKRKAVENKLISQAVADQMDDQAAINLVFAPGLSTSEVVSDLSGRGVGMDVVRSAVEKANGSVWLESALGLGTTIRISLPLSMAMTQVMVVESDRQQFGVPLDQVIETVRLPRSAVRKIKRNLTALWRGSVLPLRPLNALLNLSTQPRTNEEDEWAVLVAEVKGERVGILVDQFYRTTEIIQKPLEGVLANLAAYSGSALLGDGSVLMVLNLPAVL